MSSIPRRLRSPIVVAVLLAGVAPTAARSQAPERSAPPDTTPYVRPILVEDLFPAGRAALLTGRPQIFIVDVVINNTNANLTNTDTANDGETSIAINPANPDEIAATAFSGSWPGGGGNAPVWHSTDGGLTWTKQFTIPNPTGVNITGPNDQALDFGRNSLLSGAFLNNSDVYSGTTTNAASAAAWSWFLQAAVAQRTNNNVAGSFGNVDQPWILVNRDPTTAAQDNVYVAYDNFGGSNPRVAVSYGLNPPNFTTDQAVGGAFGGSVNPGLRMAKDPNTGFIYALWQQNQGGVAGGFNVDYMLNRSIDGGATWSLNGAATGIVVANADSTQACSSGCGCPCPSNTFKFGGVNALLGGVDHAAVDPVTGDVYYVYGNRDGVTGNNRLAVRRIVSDGAGGMIVGSENFVTGQVDAAIPSIAVLTNRTVGVFYYTFDGYSSSNFPIFTAHLALSSDFGVSFSDITLLTFLSSAKDCFVDPSFCNAECPMGATNSAFCRQRVLGDYMQMKAVGRTFYGMFTGNGAPFGRPFANHDPIFFRVTIAPVISVPGNVAFQTTCVGSTGTQTLSVCNTGTENLQISSITSSDPQFQVTTPTSGYPLFISPDFCFPFQVTFTPTSSGSQTATLTIVSNDPATPSTTVQVTGTGGEPDIGFTGLTDFGNVCPEGQASTTVSICNTGSCDLHVTSVAFDPPCPDFTIVNNPFPATVSPDFCLGVVIVFTPTSLGPKSCTLKVASDDPDEPILTITVTANTPSPMIDVPPDVSFPPVVIQSVGPCEKLLPFPISNTGTCNLTITEVAIITNQTEYSVVGLPSYPIVLQPGHIVGEGHLHLRFAPVTLGRNRTGQVRVTYVSNPVSGATTSVTRNLCGEGVRTGARLLVTSLGVPLAVVKKIQLHRVNANQNGNPLDSIDSINNAHLHTIAQAAPCSSYQFQAEWGSVDNPILLLPGVYRVSVMVKIGNNNISRKVGFSVDTCDFNQTIVVDIP